MKLFKTFFIYSTVFIGVFFFTLLFQNCGQFTATSSSSEQLSPNHPPIEIEQKASVTRDRLLLGDAFYVMSVFRDVFAGENSHPDITGFVEYVLREEILSAQTEFGRACSLFHDGALQNCNGNVFNQSINMKSSSSSLREAARLQTCQRLVNNDYVLTQLINKVKGSSDAPTKESVSRIVLLFFPALDSTKDFETSLLKLETRMVAGAEPVIDRWRLIVFSVCEEPGWQLL